jgi:hypothetical protein
MDRIPHHWRLAGTPTGCPHWPPAWGRNTMAKGELIVEDDCPY